ncbi:MAG: hypothetical protein GX415_05055 [Chloroflexi bacterium]|jgi:hypothetical protein|nr:hypothetical protein [Anaerolineaceae bacterium]NLI44763.1 hypothetical protein [Chloroflexota bacterium]HOE35217.1 hypothetical protein [Anaerolineaceae bacterium]HOT25549.1 hypothetical protein [Anaerolineaceae bacterium]HQK03441.1 hypothetical protein [Anaerolineaceae bacterium]
MNNKETLILVQAPQAYQPHRWVPVAVSILAFAAFLAFILPNAKASEDLGMVQVFEPDEAALFPTIAAMASPKSDSLTFIKQFIVYERYNKGFPFYGPSALLLIPLRWAGQEKNFSLTFLLLRQVISVLPMLCGLLVLVWLQDGFRTYRSIVLFVFLLIVPATIQNGFWWHPDGLTLLLSVLVVWFLYKDALRFGKYFFAAAAACGVLTAAKMMGVFFFLSVFAVLIWGLVEKKITLASAVLRGVEFIGVMGAAFLISSPFLFSEWGRAGYLNMLRAQMSSLSEGYGVIYAKGFPAAWPAIREYFGSAVFLLLSLVVCVLGLASKKNRFLNTLLLTWFLPLTLYVTFFSHFKYQYWLPVALPLFSCWAQVLPEDIKGFRLKNWRAAVQIVLLLVFAGQLVSFALQSTRLFTARVHRAENNPYIAFQAASAKMLAPISALPLRVYYDYRLYVPEFPGWELSTAYVPISYAQITEDGYDVLLLANQRVLDYLNPEVEGVDAALFAESQRFYRDVAEGKVQGFVLLNRNEAGAIFIRQDLCEEYYPEANCD